MLMKPAAAFALGLACSLGVAAQGVSQAPKLTASDVKLYLSVMRAAAERVEHPTATDRAEAERAEEAEKRQRAEYDRFASAHKGGTKATPEEIARLKASNPSDRDLAAMKHAHALRFKPDRVIVEERHIDPRYWPLKNTIEQLASFIERSEERPGGKPANLDPALKQNIATLKPHLAEIRKLLAVVHRGREKDDDD